MDRFLGRVLACVALGVGVVYASENLRLRVDDAPSASAQPARGADGFATIPLPPIPVSTTTPQATAATSLISATTQTGLAAPGLGKPVLEAKDKFIGHAPDLTKAGVVAYRANATKIKALTFTAPTGATHLTLDLNGSTRVVPKDAGKFDDIDLRQEGYHTLKVFASDGNGIARGDFAQIAISVRLKGPHIDGVAAVGFGMGKSADQVMLLLTPHSDLVPSSVKDGKNYSIENSNSVAKTSFGGAVYTASDNEITVTVSGVKPGAYVVSVPMKDNTIVDLYGNKLEKSTGAAEADYFTATIYTQTLEQLPLPTQGVALQHGPYVAMHEYQTRPPSPGGFNPADRVETRVSRLYYYRDAHRVAMIVNRSVKSYAAASVDIRQRSAERARDDAEKHTIERKRLQMVAFRAAQDARAAEKEVQAAQSQAAAGTSENAKAKAQLEARERDLFDVDARLAGDSGNTTLQANKAALEREITRIKAIVTSTATTAAHANAGLARLQDRSENLRDNEVKATESWQVKELEETRLRGNEFRLDVAAATADPITYAPGVPDSHDPVQQVSLSVIGEGLIQLRGPIKGINIIRIMINQIDAPVGQVRIAVHTVQVNGERGNRMEKVVANIQRYIDHSRFLTAASSQMLKNAVTTVAARRAEAVAAELGPLCTQEARDRKYLHAFFGKDFIDELTLLDSEFLKTGNKLLSLHSMDSTSLSSALFLMALAKNEVRREILVEFQAQLQGELPNAEFNYYLAGLTPEKCDACCDKKHYMLAQNAKFQSFIGFFNTEVAGSDTLTPLQRGPFPKWDHAAAA